MNFYYDNHSEYGYAYWVDRNVLVYKVKQFAKHWRWRVFVRTACISGLLC